MCNELKEKFMTNMVNMGNRPMGVIQVRVLSPGGYSLVIIKVMGIYHWDEIY